jgi:hypothetical protein
MHASGLRFSRFDAAETSFETSLPKRATARSGTLPTRVLRPNRAPWPAYALCMLQPTAFTPPEWNVLCRAAFAAVPMQL